jgi:hypothetical protein
MSFLPKIDPFRIYLCGSNAQSLFKNMKKILLAGGALSAFLLTLSLPSGCYYDNEEERFPNTSCDTAGIRYSVELRQIMQSNCDRCHLPNASNYSNIPFETYEQVKAVALSGKLVDRINDASSPMPQDAGLMSLCNRQKIEAWVNAGAPNN